MINLCPRDAPDNLMHELRQRDRWRMLMKKTAIVVNKESRVVNHDAGASSQVFVSAAAG
jgi:hypothetical protein